MEEIIQFRVCEKVREDRACGISDELSRLYLMKLEINCAKSRRERRQDMHLQREMSKKLPFSA